MKKKYEISIVAIIGLTGIISYSGQVAGKSDPDDPQTEIHELRSQFIEHREADEAEACVSIYQPDALYMPNEFEASNGQGKILQFYQSPFDRYESSRYTHNTEIIHFSEDLAVEYATFQVDWISNEGD